MSMDPKKKTDPISSSSHGPAVYCSGPQQKKHRAAIRRIRIRLQSDSHLLFVAHGLTHSLSLGHVRLLSRSQPSLSALPGVMINVFGNKIFLLVSYSVRCKLCSVQWICFFLSLIIDRHISTWHIPRLKDVDIQTYMAFVTDKFCNRVKENL